jgi:crossover junction endodeoxyribonuclease RusA
MIELPWPHKILWPNGSVGNRFVKSGQTKKHKEWAFLAALSEGAPYFWNGGKNDRIPVLLKFYPKPRGPAPDKDNAQASVKAYLDGVAKAMGVDDRLFDPRTEIASERLSCVRLYVGEEAL